MDRFLKKLEDECFDVEYKEKESEGLYKTICAFANTSGGCIVLGIDDDKNIVGIKISEKDRKKIADKISDTLGLHPDIKSVEHNSCKLLKITVAKSDNPPVIYKSTGYKRVDNTTREMTKEDLRKLMRSGVHWEVQENDCPIREIDEGAIKTFREHAIGLERLPEFAQNEDVAATLERLGLMHNGKLTNGAVLLFGKNPQKYFPNADIRIGRFDCEKSQYLRQAGT